MSAPALAHAPLTRHVRDALGVQIHIQVGRVGHAQPVLSCTEQARCGEFPHPERVASWRNGRALLQRVLFDLGRSQDTAQLCFPHPTLSLSHSGEWAVAVGADALAGLGVDLELNRPGNPAIARLFLSEREMTWWTRLSGTDKNAELLRLWTVKEAVFKACAPNAQVVLADIALAEPAARTGRASLSGAPLQDFRYCSVQVAEGWLSVAVAHTPETP